MTKCGCRCDCERVEEAWKTEGEWFGPFEHTGPNGFTADL